MGTEGERQSAIGVRTCDVESQRVVELGSVTVVGEHGHSDELAWAHRDITGDELVDDPPLDEGNGR